MSNYVSGVLHSINVSDGGVPKLPCGVGEVRFGGIAGDRQRDLRYHGGPLRAVSLYSLELIHALQDEGHPLDVGSIGENITLAGIAWERMAPGATVKAGAVLLELTANSSACRRNCIRDGAGSMHACCARARFKPATPCACND